MAELADAPDSKTQNRDALGSTLRVFAVRSERFALHLSQRFVGPGASSGGEVGAGTETISRFLPDNTLRAVGGSSVRVPLCSPA
jgi:hypothetical protein